MTRKRAKNPEGKFLPDDPMTPDVNEAWVETPDSVVESSPEEEAPAPPSAPGPAPSKEEIETDVRTKLSRKTEQVDPFIPQTPAQVDAEAKRVAKEKGFDLNRGTSIGARLMARRNLSR